MEIQGEKQMHIMLDHEDFRVLVNGGIVSYRDSHVRIALADIGFAVMDAAIEEAKKAPSDWDRPLQRHHSG